MSDRESIEQDYRDAADDDAWRRQQAKREAEDYGDHVDEEVEVAMCACCASQIDPTEIVTYGGQGLCPQCVWSDTVEILGGEVDRIGPSPVSLDARWEAFEALEGLMATVKERLMREQKRIGRVRWHAL